MNGTDGGRQRDFNSYDLHQINPLVIKPLVVPVCLVSYVGASLPSSTVTFSYAFNLLAY